MEHRFSDKQKRTWITRNDTTSTGILDRCLFGPTKPAWRYISPWERIHIDLKVCYNEAARQSQVLRNLSECFVSKLQVQNAFHNKRLVAFASVHTKTSFSELDELHAEFYIRISKSGRCRHAVNNSVLSLILSTPCLAFKWRKAFRCLWWHISLLKKNYGSIVPMESNETVCSVNRFIYQLWRPEGHSIDQIDILKEEKMVYT